MDVTCEFCGKPTFWFTKTDKAWLRYGGEIRRLTTKDSEVTLYAHKVCIEAENVKST